MAQSQTVMPLILDYRECSKIKSSFCDPLAQITGRDGLKKNLPVVFLLFRNSGSQLRGGVAFHAFWYWGLKRCLR
jgi:hypothetical protein